MGTVCSPLCFNLIVQAEGVDVQARKVNLCNVVHCDNTLVVYHEFCRFLSYFSGTEFLSDYTQD